MGFGYMVKTITLVACVQKKHKGPMRARSLYRSDLFKKTSAYTEKISDEWYILSAKYKLLSPDEIIGYYNLSLKVMSAEERRIWSAEVFDELKKILTSDDKVIILAGEKDREYLVDPIRQLGCDVDIPMANLRIGEQLAWLKAQLQEP